jgi:hypothetical protein
VSEYHKQLLCLDANASPQRTLTIRIDVASKTAPPTIITLDHQPLQSKRLKTSDTVTTTPYVDIVNRTSAAANLQVLLTTTGTMLAGMNDHCTSVMELLCSLPPNIVTKYVYLFVVKVIRDR